MQQSQQRLFYGFFSRYGPPHSQPQSRREAESASDDLNRACLSENVKWQLRFIRAFGYFPLSLENATYKWWLVPWSLLLIALNAYLFTYKALPAAQTFVFFFGYWHGFTVSAFIALTKPLMTCLHLTLFVWKCSEQRVLWKRMNEYERMLCNRLGWRVVVTHQTRIFNATIVAILIFLNILRTADSLKNGQRIIDYLKDFTGHAVPIITLWSMLPTLYFYLVYSILAGWCKRIHRETLFDENKNFPSTNVRWRHSLTTINSATNELVHLLTLASDTFGPWILLTQFSSLAVLTFCITFNTTGYMQLPSHIIEMSTDQEIQDGLLQLHFNIVWSGIQVVFAIVNILVIDRYGVQLNETIRLLILRLCQRIQVNPQLTNDDSNDAGFVVTSLQGLYYAQPYWGVTACRMYLIERSGLLTMLSLMATYAAVLTQMRDMNEPDALVAAVLGDIQGEDV